MREGELLTFAVGWVMEKRCLSNKEKKKKKLYLACPGFGQYNRFKGLDKRR